MIKKILIRLLVLVMSLSAMAFVGCKNDAEKEGEVIVAGGNVINEFNNLSDLYKVKWSGAGYGTTASLDINKDTAYIKEGDGSLVLNTINYSWPELVFYNEKTDISNMDVSDLKNISVWIYNDCEKDVKATVNLLNKSNEHLLSEEFNLISKQWTLCTMKINAVVTKYAKEQISGYSIQFKTNDSVKFYLDEFKAEFGKEFTEEDNGYIAQIEETIAKINELPTDIKITDNDKIEEAFNKYNTLPDIYKSAVNNYSTLKIALTSILDLRNKEEAKLETAEINRDIFYFDKYYGVGQLSKMYSSKIDFGYSSEIKYGEESGSTYVKFNQEIWNYFQVSTSVILTDYDYINFAVYNEGLEKAMWLDNGMSGGGWNNRKQLKPNTWTEISVPATAFNRTNGQFIITTSVNSGVASPADGKIYLSKIVAKKVGQKEMFVSAVEFNDALLQNATKTTVGDLIKITLTGDGEAILSLNKKVQSIYPSQVVVCSVNSPFSTNFTLLDSNNTEISNGRISLIEGFNTIKLTSQQYNDFAKIKISSTKDTEFTFGTMYSIMESDLQGMRLVIERNYMPTDISTWTEENLIEAIDYISIYNNKLMYLQSQFVKVQEGEELYDTQLALYNEIKQQIEAKIDRIKVLMEQAVDEIDLVNFDMRKANLIKQAYSKYTQSSLLKTLSSAYVEKIDQINITIESMPSQVFNFENNTDRAKFATQTEYFPWEGQLKAVDDVEKGKVLGIVVNRLLPLPTSGSHSNIELKYDITDVNLLGYDYVTFNIYNPKVGRYIYFTTLGFGVTKAKFSLKADCWNEISIPVSAFTTAGYIILTDISTSAVEPLTILFDSVYAYNEKYVIKKINDLPLVENVTIESYQDIQAVEELYNKLSSTFKNKVSNYGKLQSLQAKIVSLMIEDLPSVKEISSLDYTKINAITDIYENLTQSVKDLVNNYSTFETYVNEYDKKFKVVNDMTDATFLKVNHDGYGNGDVTTMSTGTDEVYGGYISAYISGATHDHLVFNPVNKQTENIREKDKVVFYVYNGGEKDRYFMAKIGSTLNPEMLLLKAGQWTKIELTGKQYTDLVYMGIYNAKANTDPCEYKFSTIIHEINENALESTVKDSYNWLEKA